MRIELNGTAVETAAATLAALIEEQGYEAASVATALNGQFVPLAARDTATLHDGAKVEALSPMQGG
ncbi:sulfur carrier protein ThiS [Thalassovita aquimarina]|uniref:Sulfur carrier protein ThiS n=1 Tax=Thalassovita aquimarina TaxID=2785917 RepID=A0ABS5HUT7_9RHOB|nr:sulfur carrier protein ThiS [Thalassovita aquimarina]MBR9652750.1 sulfur carrier protein ThiS [Thalassovita aquimarina]